MAGGINRVKIGRYHIDQVLGRGAMGVVYRGKDQHTGRVVAIKTMPLAEHFDSYELQGAKDRFFREAATAGRLNHLDMVTIVDAG